MAAQCARGKHGRMLGGDADKIGAALPTTLKGAENRDIAGLGGTAGEQDFFLALAIWWMMPGSVTTIQVASSAPFFTAFEQFFR